MAFVTRARDALERYRPRLIALGLLLLALSFAIGAYAIALDYELRARGQWTGATGTLSGIAAHQHADALGSAGSMVARLLTIALALLVIVPRRVESALFRRAGWVAILVAMALLTAAAVGLVGVGFYAGLASYDPRCPLDAPCSAAVHAMPPSAWRTTYLGVLAFGATLSAAALASSLGLRWVLWGIQALSRRSRSRA